MPHFIQKECWKPNNRLVSGKSRYICSASVATAAWGKIQSHADSLQGLWEIGQTKISKKRYLRCFARFYGRTPANHLGCKKSCNTKINWISIGARFPNHPQSNHSRFVILHTRELDPCWTWCASKDWRLELEKMIVSKRDRDPFFRRKIWMPNF